ncbi:MAG: hypothetical protein WC815_18200 [Vicinamibacterales bacterium]|jgi:hypothetical protein
MHPKTYSWGAMILGAIFVVVGLLVLWMHQPDNFNSARGDGTFLGGLGAFQADASSVEASGGDSVNAVRRRQAGWAMATGVALLMFGFTAKRNSELADAIEPQRGATVGPT